MMTLKTPLLIVSLLLLAGCIPTIKKQWDVQPVEGTVVDAETGEPVAGATIISRNNPSLIATSDSQGRFVIEEQTHVGFHMLMAASALDHQVWQVSHPHYENGIAETTTFIPPLSRELRTPLIPLFQTLPASPESCPDFGYLLKFGQWQAANGKDTGFFEPDPCQDAAALDTLYNVWFPDQQ